MNLLAYAGCLHRFDLNENGYLQIDVFGYDHQRERFEKIIDKPLIPSMTMKSNRFRIVGSCLNEKGLGVLLHLIGMNSSILMFIQIQSRPCLCQIIYTLSMPKSNYGSMKFLSINSFMSVFINEEKPTDGFYIVENQQQTSIQLVSCSLLTYIYCYLKEKYFWIMGYEIDSNTQRKTIKVYYGCSTSLVSFSTHKLIPISLVDNIQDLHILTHKLQLRPRLIIGDVIISSRDRRIFTCHHGSISHELTLNHLIISIHSYLTIENEQLFLFVNKDTPTIEIFQYHENLTLTSYNNTQETADRILIDDFTQIGWKQILFLKTPFDFNSFLLTDFSQIHSFQHESDDVYNLEEKHLSMEIDGEGEIQTSLLLAQDILRKKIINADFIVNEGYFQCKQIENNIRKITNQNHIPDLNIQSDSLTQNSIHSTTMIQLIDLNWFVYQTNLFLYTTIKNMSDSHLTSVHLFGIDKHSNRMRLFQLKISSQSSLNEQMIFNLNPQSSLVFTLITSIDLDRDIDIDLYILLNDNNQLFHVGSMVIPLDDLINPTGDRMLKLTAFENKSFIYLNTLFRLNLHLQSTARFHFQEFLSTIGFRPFLHLSNVYIRINEGTIFQHILIHLPSEDHSIVHIYAKDSNEATMMAKYILSKLDFQSFSLVDSMKSFSEEENHRILHRIQIELTSYIDLFKDIPTIMRKIVPNSKSESYRLVKSDNFQSFQNECYLTDLFLASFIRD